MELELAGTLWKDSLHDVARDVLLRTYTFRVVDELIPLGRQVTYEDVARMAAGHPGSEPPSILKAIFPDRQGQRRAHRRLARQRRAGCSDRPQGRGPAS